MSNNERTNKLISEEVDSNENKDILSQDENIFIRAGNKIISFIVGLSAFFIFKLIFMVPGYLLLFIADPKDLQLINSIGGVFILLAIYLAVKYTQKLNKSKTRNKNIKRLLTVIVGFISMVITTVALNM